MTVGFTELCSTASSAANLQPMVPDEERLALLMAQAIGMVVEKDNCGISEICDVTARIFVKPHEEAVGALTLYDLKELASLGADREAKSDLRLGALSTLTALSTLYEPAGDRLRQRDLLATASYTLLRELGDSDPTSTHGRFSREVVGQLAHNPSAYRDEAGIVMFDASVVGAADTQIAEDIDNETIIDLRDAIKAKTVDVLSSKVAEKMTWIAEESWPESIELNPVVLEGKIQGYIADLTGLSKLTEEFSIDIESSGQRDQAMRYTQQGVTKLLQGRKVKNVRAVTGQTNLANIYYEGNKGSNATLIRSYYMNIGEFEGAPVFGVIALVRTKGNEHDFLSLVMPYNVRKGKLR